MVGGGQGKRSAGVSEHDGRSKSEGEDEGESDGEEVGETEACVGWASKRAVVSEKKPKRASERARKE